MVDVAAHADATDAAPAALLLCRPVPEGEVPRELLELPLQVVLGTPLTLPDDELRNTFEFTACIHIPGIIQFTQRQHSKICTHPICTLHAFVVFVY